jgi:hypothetical protein
MTPMQDCTVPITEWYTNKDLSGAQKRRISSKFLRRDLYKDHLNRPFPRGWTRHPHEPETSPKKMYRVDHTGKYYAYPSPDAVAYISTHMTPAQTSNSDTRFPFSTEMRNSSFHRSRNFSSVIHIEPIYTPTRQTRNRMTAVFTYGMKPELGQALFYFTAKATRSRGVVQVRL